MIFKLTTDIFFLRKSRKIFLIKLDTIPKKEKAKDVGN